MEWVALAVSLLMGSLLLWAGLEKARALSSFAATASSLGVPQRLARPSATALVLTELAVAGGLVFCPGRLWVSLGVVLLALTFAGAGLIALRSDEPIRCHCLGAGSGRLGRHQLFALAPWLAGVAVLHFGIQEQLLLAAGAERLAAVGLGLASLRAVAVWQARDEARGDRIMAMETYLWPR